jgi:hypothetical protein
MKKMEDAKIQTQIGLFDVEISWILRPDNAAWPITYYTGKSSYPKSRWITSGPVFCKNKVDVLSAEDMFWNIVTLFHLMAERWTRKTGQNPIGMIKITKPNEENAFTVFPFWEMKVKLKGIEYFLKYKYPKNRMGIARICIWTETKNQIKYLQEFMPNIRNIPQGVLFIMDQERIEEVEEIIEVEVMNLGEHEIIIINETGDSALLELDNVSYQNQTSQELIILTENSVPKEIWCAQPSQSLVIIPYRNPLWLFSDFFRQCCGFGGLIDLVSWCDSPYHYSTYD